MKNAFKLGAIFAGAFIGAGFASGTELSKFFLKYGAVSFWGILLAGLLLFICFTKILIRIKSYDITCFCDYFTPYIGKKAALAFEYITVFFMVSAFYVMVSGSGAMFSQSFGASPIWGMLAMLLACFVSFVLSTRFLAFINAVLLPVMTLGIIILSLAGIFQAAPVFRIRPLYDNFLVSSLLYVSYNVLTLICVILPYKKYITSKKTALKGGLVASGFVFVMAVLIWFCLFLNQNEVAGLEIPLLHIARQNGRFFEILYFIILFFAMYTTATANGFAVLSRIKNYKMAPAALLCLSALAVSLFSFSALVEHLYSFFGFLGFGVLVLVLII